MDKYSTIIGTGLSIPEAVNDATVRLNIIRDKNPRIAVIGISDIVDGYNKYRIYTVEDKGGYIGSKSS